VGIQASLLVLDFERLTFPTHSTFRMPKMNLSQVLAIFIFPFLDFLIVSFLSFKLYGMRNSSLPQL
jgi:hypothetical protein